MLLFLFSISAVFGIAGIGNLSVVGTHFERLPVSIFLLNCFACLVLGLTSLFNIGFSIWFVILINAVVGVFCFWLRFRRTTKFAFARVPIADSKDLLVYGVMLVFTIACVVMQFSPSLRINYFASDPAVHLRQSLEIARGAVPKGQFFAYIPDACLLACTRSVVQGIDVYKVHIIVDSAFFYLSGLVFYSILKSQSMCHGKLTTVILVLLYTMGYPLNNMVFGFCYLGTGVTLVGVTIVLFNALIEQEHSPCGKCTEEGQSVIQKLRFSLLSLPLFGLIISYSLFVPPVYLGIFVAMVVALKKRRLTSVRIVACAAQAFAVPVVLGFFIVFLSIFSGGTTVGSAIATEGGIFRDLYSSFLVFLPIGLFGLFTTFSFRNAESCVTCCTTGFIAILFLLGITGRVSSYYYFKCYFLLWLLLFIFLAQGCSKLLKKSRPLLLCYAGVFGFVFVIGVSGIDARFSAARPLFSPTPMAKSYFPLYFFNFQSMKRSPYDDDKIFLYKKAARLKNKTNDCIPILATDADTYWYSTLTNQDQKDFQYWTLNSNALIDRAKKYRYMVVVLGQYPLNTRDGKDPVASLKQVLSKGTVKYRNQSGYIVELPN